MDTVTASLASMGNREVALKETIDSLLKNPFDRINVYLHGFDNIPIYLSNDRIVVATDKEHGDRGDADKFFWAEETDGFHFTCDDDLIYPEDYVDVMTSKIEKYKRSVVVSALGHWLCEFPMKNYFGIEHRKCWGCLTEVIDDHFCMYGGTGVMAYHSDTIRPNMQAFSIPNMSDIWFGLLCRHKNVPVLAVEHQDQWIKYTEHVALGDTIAGQTLDKNQLQCEVLNAFNHFYGWKPLISDENGNVS